MADFQVGDVENTGFFGPMICTWDWKADGKAQ
jgi:hypothetical protein